MVAAPPPPTIHASIARITKRRPEGEAKPESYHIDSLENQPFAAFTGIWLRRHRGFHSVLDRDEGGQAPASAWVSLSVRMGKSADVPGPHHPQNGASCGDVPRPISQALEVQSMISQNKPTQDAMAHIGPAQNMSRRAALIRVGGGGAALTAA